MNALADVSIYVVTNRTPYLKCDLSVSIYVAVAFTPNHPTDPYLREGLSQTMLLVTRVIVNIKVCFAWSLRGLQATIFSPAPFVPSAAPCGSPSRFRFTKKFAEIGKS